MLYIYFALSLRLSSFYSANLANAKGFYSDFSDLDISILLREDSIYSSAITAVLSYLLAFVFGY